MITCSFFKTRTFLNIHILGKFSFKKCNINASFLADFHYLFYLTSKISGSRFMWQLCSSIPSTLPDPKAVSLMTAKVSTLKIYHVYSVFLPFLHFNSGISIINGAILLFFSFQLSTSFVLETFIHSKEKVFHLLVNSH